MDKKGLRTGVVILGFGAVFAGYQIWGMLSQRYVVTNFPPKGSVIVAFGDSLTAGVGASSPEKGYVSVLEKRLGTKIINKGTSGDTTELALLRLGDVLILEPNTVLVFLGGNDMIQRVPRETTFNNLTTIIRQFQEHGAVVILIGLDGPIGNGYRKDFDALAKNTGSMYIPNVMDGITGDPKLLSDEVHPNDAGYLKIADKIAPTLEGVILSALPLQSEHYNKGTSTVLTSPASE